MLKAKISEIFQSIQGEGKYSGVRQVFVRFFGCHMHCAWCDTPDSIGDGKKEYKEYSAPDLYREVKTLAQDCHSISLTGGEPLLQADFIKAFIPYLRKTGAKIYLETSGVLHKELKKVIDDVDIVSMDFKLPSSTKCRAFWKEHEQFLKIAKKKDVFVKAVITSATQKKDVKRTAEIISGIDPQLFFVLQPNWFDVLASGSRVLRPGSASFAKHPEQVTSGARNASKDWFDRQNGVMEKCLAFQSFCLQYLANVRVMPQMHKYMKMR